MRKSNNESGLTTQWSYRRLIVGLIALAVSLAVQAQDLARIGERTIMGTARYVGFGGAMTAIGGDPSAVLDNPAGLGLYRRMEVLATFDHTWDRTCQEGTKNQQRRNIFMVPQVSMVFSLPSYAVDDDSFQFHNFMVSFQRRQTYNRDIYGYSLSDASLGALLAQKEAAGLFKMDIPYCSDPIAENELLLRESGYVHQFTFDYSFNYANKWYFGAGLRVHSYHLSSQGEYLETFDQLNAEGKPMDNLNETSLILRGSGVSFSTGLIYRPLSWLRLGVGLETASVGNLNTLTSGTFSSRTDSVRYEPTINMRDRESGSFQPWHLSTSVAFQVGAYGMLALQYDYRHQRTAEDVHSLRCGLEVVPVLGLYINVGYVYESSFSKKAMISPMESTFNRQDTYSFQPKWSQYVSAAIGYRGKHVIAQAAYQYRWQRLNVYAHEAAQPYAINADTHRLVVTIGWHHNY